MRHAAAFRSLKGLASPDVAATARDLVSQAAYSPINAGHAYPLLGVAPYLAVQQAEAAIGVERTQLNSSGNGIGAGVTANSRQIACGRWCIGGWF
jgi:hypothetical protein